MRLKLVRVLAQTRLRTTMTLMLQTGVQIGKKKVPLTMAIETKKQYQLNSWALT